MVALGDTFLVCTHHFLLLINKDVLIYHIELLSFFSTDPLHTDKLKEFASTSLEGQTELNAYCTRPRRTYFEVLSDFNSVKCPPQYLFDLIPSLRPRSYSIASSPKAMTTVIFRTYFCCTKLFLANRCFPVGFI